MALSRRAPFERALTRRLAPQHGIMPMDLSRGSFRSRLLYACRCSLRLVREHQVRHPERPRHFRRMLKGRDSPMTKITRIGGATSLASFRDFTSHCPISRVWGTESRETFKRLVPMIGLSCATTTF